MLEIALELLKIIEKKGYKAYLVGGCVRDLLLEKDLVDIDVASSATMYDLQDINEFKFMKSTRYGSSILIYKKIKFELTTFREEGKYIDGRRPSEYKYTSSILVDSKRRDFTMNSIYMDKDRNIIDFNNGLDDIDKKIVRMIGDPDERLCEDALRILRAIRFATTLGFKLDNSLKQAIIKNRDRLSILSYQRRKKELDKIFVSDNRIYGINLLIETHLDEVLELHNLSTINPIDDIVGIWAQIRNEKYVIGKSLSNVVNKIQEILDNNIDIMNNYTLYKYGLYICMVVCKIRKESINNLIRISSNMPLTCFDEIDIETKDILECVKIEDERMIGTIYDDIVDEILSCKLSNKKDVIISYLKNKYNVLK